MSKSRHVTLMGVFRGKSKKQINSMIKENDLDVELLREKKRLKIESQSKKAKSKQAE